MAFRRVRFRGCSALQLIYLRLAYLFSSLHIILLSTCHGRAPTERDLATDYDAYCMSPYIETTESTLLRAYQTHCFLAPSRVTTTHDSEKGVLVLRIYTVYYCPYQM